MISSSLVKFAETAAPATGIGAFNVNIKAFLFQLATFTIVLLVLRKYIFPKLVATLEARRKTLEESLIQARETEEALKRAEEKAGSLLSDARAQADEALSEAHKKAEEIIANAEGEGAKKAKLVIDEARQHLDLERQKLHDELRGELADLVIKTTEKVIGQKLDAKADGLLIEKSLKETSS